MAGDAHEVIQGTPVVAGMAYAPVVWVTRPQALQPSKELVPQEDRAAESQRYETAVGVVADRLSQRAHGTVGTASDVLLMMSALAADKGIRRETLLLIDQGRTAADAITEATEVFSAKFRLAGGLMAERIADLEDVRDRIVAEILGKQEPGIPTPSSPVILLADDLSPADTAGFNPAMILAIATRMGGATSHTAIIARQIGIPCIVAAQGLDNLREGEEILFDGASGRLQKVSDPDAARDDVDRDRRWRERARQWNGPAITRDGFQVELLVNVQDGAGAKASAEGPAEGVGLLRTELCFLEEKEEPSIERQELIYSKVFQAFPRGKVVVRTLDAGSDKPIPYATVAGEENPALGVRGLRLRDTNPDVLKRQMEAIARAAQGHPKAWVMAPMVSTIEEAQWFVAQAHEYGLRGGIMVEVPAVALQARRFLQVVDFVSIGTNDLTQYVMAADRLSPYLAKLTDSWQPAVLELIAMTAKEGRRLNKPVSVCGEAAADPLLACVLTGMGVSSLSVAPPLVSMVGAQLSAVTYRGCVRAARAVADARDALDARERARLALSF